MNCAVLVIAKDDFDDLKNAIAVEIEKPTEKVSDLEFLIK